MDYEDDFFFEEDKILKGRAVLSATKGTWKELDEKLQEDCLVLLTTVPSASAQSDQYTMMEDRMGMTITSGNVVIQKDSSNLIGISIGGGAPQCRCLYIVQVFDNTPAALDGTLQAGDELVAVNGSSVRGKTKVEVAKMIQSCDSQVSINYNKLHADPKQGRTLDIALKKVKHRLVEGMGSATADALGLSHAILCNDALVQRLMALQRTEYLYRGLVSHAQSTLHAFFDLTQIYKVFGDAFAAIGVREPQPRASEAFRQFGEQHRQMEKFGVTMLKSIKPILNDLALQEPLYRMETGNYEYRLVLRCRQEARAKFAKLRSDVLVKLELLDNKHVQDVVWQLQKFAAGLGKYYSNTRDLLSAVTLFPVEVDLSHSAFQYKSIGSQMINDDGEDIDEYEPEEKSNNEELLIDTRSFTDDTPDVSSEPDNTM
ncbi:protein interacting with PRKCA 1 isoform X2 [Lasioglossum baleicum]|uniref:protein interacting with PRKCA 1 isoform X2 n=1 Tax=Lasioglossum baleicum TaxID=434251 RepID=UPI003FCC4656